jgi:predicted metal-binding membrane protein
VARFALRNGLACVGSCWALMLIMALAAGAQLLWMPALTALVCAEKLSKRPLRATRRTAYLLGVAALCGGLLAAQPA